MTRARLLSTQTLTSTLTAIACALALGALWAFWSFRLGDAQWPAFAVGACLALVLRAVTSVRPWANAVLALLATLLAAFYAECLQMALRIAHSFGLTLWEVVRTSGVVSLSQLTWRLLPDQRLHMYCAAAVLAAIIAWLPLARRAARERTPRQ